MTNKQFCVGCGKPAVGFERACSKCLPLWKAYLGPRSNSPSWGYQVRDRSEPRSRFWSANSPRFGTLDERLRDGQRLINSAYDGEPAL